MKCSQLTASIVKTAFSAFFYKFVNTCIILAMFTTSLYNQCRYGGMVDT